MFALFTHATLLCDMQITVFIHELLHPTKSKLYPKMMDLYTEFSATNLVCLEFLIRMEKQLLVAKTLYHKAC